MDFLKKHSTTTNLLESVNDLSLALSNHHSIIFAFLLPSDESNIIHRKLNVWVAWLQTVWGLTLTFRIHVRSDIFLPQCFLVGFYTAFPDFLRSQTSEYVKIDTSINSSGLQALLWMVKLKEVWPQISRSPVEITWFFSTLLSSTATIMLKTTQRNFAYKLI